MTISFIIIYLLVKHQGLGTRNIKNTVRTSAPDHHHVCMSSERLNAVKQNQMELGSE